MSEHSSPGRDSSYPRTKAPFFALVTTTARVPWSAKAESAGQLNNLERGPQA